MGDALELVVEVALGTTDGVPVASALRVPPAPPPPPAAAVRLGLGVKVVLAEAVTVAVAVLSGASPPWPPMEAVAEGVPRPLLPAVVEGVTPLLAPALPLRAEEGVALC